MSTGQRPFFEDQGDSGPARPSAPEPAEVRTWSLRCSKEGPEAPWVISIPEVEGCRVEAPSLAEGRRLIRERLALVVGAELAAVAEFVRRRCACRRAWAGEVEGVSTVDDVHHDLEACLPVRKMERRRCR